MLSNKDAIRRIKDFGLYHAIGDLPKSTLTVEAFNMAIELLRLEEQGKFIELPCRVGDIVYSYSIQENDTFEFEVLEILYDISAEKYGLFIRKRIYGVVGNVYTEFNFDDFGKSIFTTREQAEQKLKENE